MLTLIALVYSKLPAIEAASCAALLALFKVKLPPRRSATVSLPKFKSRVVIVPAVCANFLAQRLGYMIVIGWAVATVASLGGLWASYEFDFPTGAAIVCALGFVLLLASAIARLRKASPPPDSRAR